VATLIDEPRHGLPDNTKQGMQNQEGFLNSFNICEDSLVVPRNCSTCLRARCICHHLPYPRPVPLNHAQNLQIIVLQHPSEITEYKNTVNLMKLCLENVHVLNGTKFKSDNGGIWDRACADTEGTYLLFPDKNATDVRQLYQNTTEYAIRFLVVLDGTWNSCKRIYKKNEEVLGRMKRVCIHPEIPSNYRIRKQPNVECLSSIEAVAYCLMVIENDQTLYDKLTKPLDGLVESYCPL
jgi:DTW domain-containing protein YfiP